MSWISKPSIAYDSTLTEIVINYRVWFDIAGVGRDGLTLGLSGIDTAGSAMTLTESTHWRQAPRTGVAGTYDLFIIVPGKLDTMGHYTFQVDPGDTTLDKLTTNFTMSGVYGRATGTITTTSFIANISSMSATDDFYNGALMLMLTGALAGSGPRMIRAYNGTTKAFTFDTMPSGVVATDVFYVERY